MKVILYIDTSDNNEIKVGLTIDGKKEQLYEPLDRQKAQVVLPLLEDLLRKNKLKVQDITAIEVNPGPGSFTGVRVGVTIANTLGFLLHVPINGKPVGGLIEPVYH